jgi:hypothetical protein
MERTSHEMDFPEEFLQRKSVDGSIEDPPFFCLFIVSKFFFSTTKESFITFRSLKREKKLAQKSSPKRLTLKRKGRLLFSIRLKKANIPSIAKRTGNTANHAWAVFAVTAHVGC